MDRINAAYWRYLGEWPIVMGDFLGNWDLAALCKIGGVVWRAADWASTTTREICLHLLIGLGLCL